MIKASRIHLAEVDESYSEHLLAASRIACLMVHAGFACAVHAIIPALCTKTASRRLEEVQKLFAIRRADRLSDEALHHGEVRLLES